MNAISLIKQDHNNVDRLFSDFEQTDDPRERRRLVNHMIEQLSVHAAIEESVLYPALRTKVGEDEPHLLEALEEHHATKHTLAEIERMSPFSQRFEAKVTVLIEQVRHHVEEEEQDIFEMMRTRMTNQELEELADRLQAARSTAPTRPHPRLGETPLNAVLGLPIAVADRVITTGRQTLERVLGRSA